MQIWASMLPMFVNGGKIPDQPKPPFWYPQNRDALGLTEDDWE